MHKMNRLTFPVVMLFAFTLSACSTAPKEEAAPVIEPIPVVEQTTAAEPVAAPEVVAEPAAAPSPAPQVVEPKPVVKKKHRKVTKAQPKPVEAAPAPAPEMTPEPTPAPVAAPVQEPVAPVVVAAPAKQVEAGFLEKYWLWLLGIVIAVAAVLLLVRKKN
ncbi:MAG: hypothetical protein A3J87_06820 [Sideroxydans sp. RIFOXYB12_FULL_59_6]|nr:MAG: hypothetical protein A3J87_06820 [Sideroxydans sp. RIFOXYB12_FULL_59_6]